MAYTKRVILTRDEITLLNKARAMVAAQRAMRKLKERITPAEGCARAAEKLARAEDRCSEAAGALDAQVLHMAQGKHA